MDSTSYWTEPRAPRERFDSVFQLWTRAGALFFEGFDYIFAVLLIIGIPASAVTVAVETMVADTNSFVAIAVASAVNSFFYAWISGPLYYGVAVRLQEGQWPRVTSGLRWIAPRWARLAAILFISSILFLIGLVAFVVPGLYLLIKLSLADAAVVYEPDRPAIKRSWNLSRYAPLSIFLALCPFLLASMLFTFGVDDDALRQTPLLAFAVDWSLLLLLATYPTIVTALLYGWLRTDEDAAAVTRLES